MACKRMFCKDIVCTDAFRELPPSAQCLYFQIGMEADDEGFCASVKGIMRLCGCKPKDLDVLIKNGLILQASERVYFIFDWKDNNNLRSDTFKPTKYTEEKQKLLLEYPGRFPTFTKRKANKREDNESERKNIKGDGERIRDVNAPYTQYSIVKNSTVKFPPKSPQGDYTPTQKKNDEEQKEQVPAEDKSDSRRLGMIAFAPGFQDFIAACPKEDDTPFRAAKLYTEIVDKYGEDAVTYEMLTNAAKEMTANQKMMSPMQVVQAFLDVANAEEAKAENGHDQ